MSSIARIRAFAVHARSFSTSSPWLARHPCYIGRTPIPIPSSITLEPTPTALKITGPKGTTSVPLEPYMSLSFQNATLNETAAIESSKGKEKVKSLDPVPTVSIMVQDRNERKQRQMWGLTRTLIHNALIGMTEGYTVPLHLVGVGYRAAMEPDPRPIDIIVRDNKGVPSDGPAMRLNMKLGYAHSVLVPIPPHIKVEVPLPTRIMVSCTDKQKLGLFAAKVRSWRKPEPYKGKGIFVGSEVIRIKAFKKK